MTDFSNSLIVPVAVNAFVVNDNMTGKSYRRWQMDINLLAKENRNPAAPPFEGGEDIKKGIYLHWSIPDALKKGARGDKGEVVFPLLPNRWLVVRYSGEPGNRDTLCRQIKSDFLGEKSREKGSRYFLKEGNKIKEYKLGKRSPVDDWNKVDKDDEQDLFLTASGFGDITFLSCQPFIQDVFSFHDKLDGVDTRYPVGYMVVGWYSRDDKDIVRQENSLNEILARLNWTVDRLPDQTGIRSLYHGVVYGIRFHEAKHAEDTFKNVHVAVGNTSVEALTALLEKWAQYRGTGADLINSELLKAFQYGLLPTLDEPDGRETVRQEIHRHWFSSKPGGILWDIVDKEKDKINEKPEKEERFLNKLNSFQENLEKMVSQLRAAQQELYELWWEGEKIPKRYLGAKITGYEEKKNNLINTISTKKSEIKRLRKKIHNYIERHKAEIPGENRVLRQVEKPPFYAPVDPVVMITGLNPPPKLDIYDTRRCRLPDQLVTGIRGRGEPPPYNAPVKNTPPLIDRLFFESFLVDAVSASLPPGDKLLPPGFTGSPLEGRDFEECFQKWEQPWAPLFMEWEIYWYPVPHKSGKQKNWEFDGQEYRFTGALTLDENLDRNVLSGRTFLTPQNSYFFKERLKRFIQDIQDDTRQVNGVNDFMRIIDQWDFISQGLHGLNEQLTQRSPDFLVPPDESIKNLVEDNYESLPDIVNKDEHFQEIRRGQFFFNRLTVYDTFGQAVVIVKDPEKHVGLKSADLFRPILDKNFEPPGTVVERNPFRFIQLPPRLLQYSRLNFTFAGENPVCGWVLPDHLDKSLEIYDEKGINLGEVRVVERSAGQKTVAWQPAPGSQYCDLEAVSEVSRHLGDFLAGLKNNGAEAFHHFIKVIDETLWTIDPLGNRNNRHLSVLIGRPLALVRATLQIEPDGPVIRHPFYWKDSIPGETACDFEARLGSMGLRQDGLIGYFKENDYSTFHAVHTFAADTGQIKKIQKGNFLSLRFGNDDCGVTMLVDPRAKVHAVTGILPVVSLSLPEKWVDDALANMEISIRRAPLLTTEKTVTIEKPGKPAAGETGETSGTETVQSVTIPIPAQTSGKWVWLQLNNGSWDEYHISEASWKPQVPLSHAGIREGFLKLSGAVKIK